MRDDEGDDKAMALAGDVCDGGHGLRVLNDVPLLNIESASKSVRLLFITLPD